MNVSYKRQSQPVDIAGEKKEGGNLSSKKTSTQKAQKIMNQLESVESKTTKIIKEDLEKMRNLISYDRKTQ
jgi:glutamate synthase domain-containing protein 3